MLQHGAGGCQGKNPLEENNHPQDSQDQGFLAEKESPRGKSLNSPGPGESLNNGDHGPSSVHTPGISSNQTLSQGVRDNLAEDFLREGLFDEYWKWTNCQKKVIPFKCLDCGREFYVPFRCDLRICPECNGRYGKIFKARYLRTIRQLLKRKRGPLRPMLLTLTTKNTGEVPEAGEIRAHNKAIGKLIRRHFKGGVSVNEVKGSFLHSHCIVFGPYVPQEKLSQDWEALTGCQVVDIREVKQKTRDVINYLGKYIKKPYRYEDNEKGRALAIQFLKNFKGVRRVHSYGLFYNIPRDKKPRWSCPYCESDMVILKWEKFQDDWQIRDCRRGGIPSYKEVLGKWAEAESNQWARA